MENSGFDLLWQWGIVFLAMAFLLYAAIVIKEEKVAYREVANSVSFHHFIFPIPSWWTKTNENSNLLEFKRTDTNYEWRARYQYFPNQDFDLTQEMEKYLNTEEIFFDEDQTVFEENPQHFIHDQSIAEKIERAIRIEGTATEKIHDRIYLDIIFLKLKNSQGFFIFQSHSSVLNGAVEGPYFEETINQLQLK